MQYARDDERPSHSCINQIKNIDNDLYCSSNEFPNCLALLTMLIWAPYTVAKLAVMLVIMGMSKILSKNTFFQNIKFLFKILNVLSV